MAGSRDKTLKLYEGHFHDLLNDIGKETVMNDIKSWVAAHMGARSDCACWTSQPFSAPSKTSTKY